MGLSSRCVSVQVQEGSQETDQEDVKTDVWRYRRRSYCGEVPVERRKEGPVEQGSMGQSECLLVQ